MRIETKNDMTIVYPDNGYVLHWEHGWANWIAVPPTKDVQEVMNECTEYTLEEQAEMIRQEELELAAEEEDYLAALAELGVEE